MRPLLLILGFTACADELDPVYDGLACGAGTTDLDGVCEIVDPPRGCVDGDVLRNGQCTAADPTLAFLPFEAGTTVQVSQGYHGALSHVGESAYAIDFAVPEGTPVHAARAGRVYSVYEASDTGCPDPSCLLLANKVVIDHGDGTFASYAHLGVDGVLVELGDVVAQGELLALSGNTGFSTGPHLHFQVRDIFGQSQPVTFAERLDLTGGVLFDGPVASENEAQDRPKHQAWSTCPPDLFAHLGVMLDPGISCSRVGGTTVISGQVVAEGAGVVVTLLDNGVVDTICAPEGGAFSVEVPWSELGYRGTALFRVSATERGTCEPVRGTSASALVDVR